MKRDVDDIMVSCGHGQGHSDLPYMLIEATLVCL